MEGAIEEWEKWGEMVFTKTENRASTRALEGTKALADTATMRANETCHKVTAPNAKELGAYSSKVPGGARVLVPGSQNPNFSIQNVMQCIKGVHQCT